MSQVCVITGGTSGIGRCTAQAMLARGYTVYELSRRAEGVAGMQHIVADVTKEETLAAAVAQILQREDHIDVLINNAGFGISGAVEFTGTEEAQRQLDVNFFGMVRMNRQVLPVMRKQGYGRIVNLSSVAGAIPIPFQTYYSASKAAINSYTMALANEVKPFGIQVCCVQPGDIRTGFTAAREKNQLGDDIYGGRIARSVSNDIAVFKIVNKVDILYPVVNGEASTLEVPYGTKSVTLLYKITVNAGTKTSMQFEDVGAECVSIVDDDDVDVTQVGRTFTVQFYRGVTTADIYVAKTYAKLVFDSNGECTVENVSSEEIKATTTVTEKDPNKLTINFADYVQKELTATGTKTASDVNFTVNVKESPIHVINSAQGEEAVSTYAGELLSTTLNAHFDSITGGETKTTPFTGSVEITSAGQYIFELREEDGQRTGVTYDETIYTLHVLVDEKEGSLAVTHWYFTDSNRVEYNAGEKAACEKYDILITGDLTAQAEYRLLSLHTLPQAAVLVAGHHGAATSTSGALLRAVRPEAVFISAGADNRFGHPAAQTLARIRQSGAAVYRTDLSGTITIRG